MPKLVVINEFHARDIWIFEPCIRISWFLGLAKNRISWYLIEISWYLIEISWYPSSYPDIWTRYPDIQKLYPDIREVFWLLERDIRISQCCIRIFQSWFASGDKYPDTKGLYPDIELVSALWSQISGYRKSVFGYSITAHKNQTSNGHNFFVS